MQIGVYKPSPLSPTVPPDFLLTISPDKIVQLQFLIVLQVSELEAVAFGLNNAVFEILHDGGRGYGFKRDALQIESIRCKDVQFGGATLIRPGTVALEGQSAVADINDFSKLMKG